MKVSQKETKLDGQSGIIASIYKLISQSYTSKHSPEHPTSRLNEFFSNKSDLIAQQSNDISYKLNAKMLNKSELLEGSQKREQKEDHTLLRQDQSKRTADSLKEITVQGNETFKQIGNNFVENFEGVFDSSEKMKGKQQMRDSCVPNPFLNIETLQSEVQIDQNSDNDGDDYSKVFGDFQSNSLSSKKGNQGGKFSQIIKETIKTPQLIGSFDQSDFLLMNNSQRQLRDKSPSQRSIEIIPNDFQRNSSESKQEQVSSHQMKIKQYKIMNAIMREERQSKQQKKTLLSQIPLFVSNPKDLYNIQDIHNQEEPNRLDKSKGSTPNEPSLMNRNEQKEFSLKNYNGISQQSFQIHVSLSKSEKNGQEAIISIENCNFSPVNCQVYTEESSHIPHLTFQNINLSEMNAGRTQQLNVFRLQGTQSNEWYEYARIPGFRDGSFLFQDIILQQMVADNLARERNPCKLYLHKNSELYLLCQKNNSISLRDIILLASRPSQRFQKLSLNELLALALPLLLIYDIFKSRSIALPDLSTQTIILTIPTLTLSFNYLYNDTSYSGNSKFILVTNIFYTYEKCYPSNDCYENENTVMCQILNQMKDALCYLDTNSEQDALSDILLLIKTNKLKEAISIIQNHLEGQKENAQVNEEVGASANGQCILINGSSLAQKISYSQTGDLNECGVLKQFVCLGTEDYSKKGDKTNFSKCNRLKQLAHVLDSLFLKEERIKTLVILKDLQADCYGVDSNEYFKTIGMLFRIYIQNKQFRYILPVIEAYSTHLRAYPLLSIPAANDLYRIFKLKVAFTKSPTANLDAQALLVYLNKVINCQQIPLNSTNSSHKDQKLRFNLAKIYFQLGISQREEDLKSAFQYFVQCVDEAKKTESLANSKLIFQAETQMARNLFKQEKFSESKAILRKLQKYPLKFVNRIYFQYLGMIELSEQNVILAEQYLHQAYVLFENESKFCKDYVDLLFNYIIATSKVKGISHYHVKYLCKQMKNFTGDLHNLECLFTLATMFGQHSNIPLALLKLEQAQQILNLLLLTSSSNSDIYKNYQKKITNFQRKLTQTSSIKA